MAVERQDFALLFFTYIHTITADAESQCAEAEPDHRTP